MKRLCLLLGLVLMAPLASAELDFKGPSPWPEIRKQRIARLLPQAMEAAGVDAWLMLCRENNNDPLADHVGGENAGSTAGFLFYTDAEGFHSRVYSPVGEATALKELAIHDEVIPVARGDSAVKQVTRFIREKNFKQLAVNMSPTNAQADGLSFTQHQALVRGVGSELEERLVSSEELVYEWLSIKLPEEVEIMRQAAILTARWQLEAYATVVPGKTTDADIARFLKAKMAEAGVGDAWAPSQNPAVNSGPDRGHSHPTERVIMPGDVIQTDFGIRVYDRWVTDIQRFAYVLKPGESLPPDDIQHYWTSARDGGKAAFKAMKPGVRGVDVDEAQRQLMEKNGSEHVMWSTGHPVGYVAHDTGPNLGGARGISLRPSALKPIKEGMVFAFDGFHAWTLEGGGQKTISVEEMVVIKKDGAEYLIPPQQELVLIGSP